MLLALHYWMRDAHHCSGTPVSEMTYTVSSGTLNSTIPYRTSFLEGVPRSWRFVLPPPANNPARCVCVCVCEQLSLMLVFLKRANGTGCSAVAPTASADMYMTWYCCVCGWQLYREVRIMKMVDHPNIGKCFMCSRVRVGAVLFQLWFFSFCFYFS